MNTNTVDEKSRCHIYLHLSVDHSIDRSIDGDRYGVRLDGGYINVAHFKKIH